MLVCLQNREDGRQNKFDEVVQEALIVLIQFNCDLSGRCGNAVREIEEVHVQSPLELFIRRVEEPTKSDSQASDVVDQNVNSPVLIQSALNEFGGSVPVREVQSDRRDVLEALKA